MATVSRNRAAHPTLVRILSQLDGVRETSNGWTARCPGHDDHNASLRVSLGDDGSALLFCQAGCPFPDICSLLGVEPKDLFAPMNSPSGNGRAEIVATYDYCDESGKPLYQAVRLVPKGFRQRRPMEGGGWSWSVKGVRRVPYRLPELLAADRLEVVWIAEGEKDADRLHKLGVVATCNVGGAGKWRAEYNKHFRGRHVVILPDNDEVGRKHANNVAGSLSGVAASVKVLKLPGLADKGDVSDWLNNGGTVEELHELAVATEEWQETATGGGKVTVDVIASSSFPLTDTGLAERFAQQHGQDVRYCYPWGKWLAWDGQRWALDATGMVDQLAKTTARAILHEAASEPDDDRRKALVAFARQAESAIRRAAMLKLARSEAGVPILPKSLNVNPWLLNCPNGTLDLRTGKLRDHRREDFITKLCLVEYDQDAHCPLWKRVVGDIFIGSVPLVEFVQRLFGYCLTGIVRDQVLPIFYGTGANGKSTMITTFLTLLGADYAMKAATDFLMLKKGEHPTERADLFGKRFVACIETDEHRRLAEALVKDLTGGDRVRARRMREDFWEFAPTHKIVLACNHKPVVRGTDHAIWRRICLVPFEMTIPDDEQDKKLPEKLATELPGILAWCVQGCLKWQQGGLRPPDEVSQATTAYRSNQDLLARFLDDCCLVGDEEKYRAKAGDLLRAYQQWAGDKLMTQRRLAQALEERGFSKRTSCGYVWWLGVGLVEVVDDVDAFSI